MKITVTMDEEIARIIQQATEFYARVGCGQGLKQRYTRAQDAGKK